MKNTIRQSTIHDDVVGIIIVTSLVSVLPSSMPQNGPTTQYWSDWFGIISPHTQTHTFTHKAHFQREFVSETKKRKNQIMPGSYRCFPFFDVLWNGCDRWWIGAERPILDSWCDECLMRPKLPPVWRGRVGRWWWNFINLDGTINDTCDIHRRLPVLVSGLMDYFGSDIPTLSVKG